MATRSILALLGTLLLAGAAHAAGTPLTLSTSGYLLDAADHPLTQQGVLLRFSVWKDPASPSDANRAWPATGESACLVDVKNGFYTAVFDGSQLSGCGAGLTSEFLPPGLERYLQVSVEGTTLTPRLRIGTVPNAAFAAQSGDAQTLIAALAASGTLNADGNPVDWTKLKAVPPGFADGVDDDTTYTAGSGGGLSLVGNAFSIAAGSVTNAMLQIPSVTVSAGTGLTGGGSAALGGSTTLSLADTTVAANTYSHPTLTIDAQGRITAASSNAVTSGTVTSVATGTGLSGGPITASGTIAIANDGVTAALLASDPASLSKVSGGGITMSGSNVGIGVSGALAATLDVNGTIKLASGTTCTANEEGALRYNQMIKSLQLCDGTGWVPVTGQVPKSCKELTDSGSGSGDGLYSIDPDGVGPLAQTYVFCDMTTLGGAGPWHSTSTPATRTSSGTTSPISGPRPRSTSAPTPPRSPATTRRPSPSRTSPASRCSSASTRRG